MGGEVRISKKQDYGKTEIEAEKATMANSDPSVLWLHGGRGGFHSGHREDGNGYGGGVTMDKMVVATEDIMVTMITIEAHDQLMCADCHLHGTLCMWTDCTTCFESCASAAGECGCLGAAGEAGLPLLFIMALIMLGLFTVIGVFYSVLVATMVGQRIWQRHYHILAKRMLTKEYVVEDVDNEMTGSDWSPPPLPPEHVQQLKTLGLL
ncbi:Zinc finger, RING-CH-type [Olea europaea subsp. europaea]|uniref:Zinc finger, RING-CH-type n=1 Tax=Olea europaea subsp. europaea TaxID=158383 RepID=A0A8S0SML5_OLEEU|nr:Zinc finger, RING-CH-type [Olea europaea subsp. europaea]